MKSHLITTALVFAGISVVHLWRFAVEGPRPAGEADLMITSILSVASSFGPCACWYGVPDLPHQALTVRGLA